MKLGGARAMGEPCYMAEVVLCEENRGTALVEKRCQILVHPESSSRTVEGIDNFIRAYFSVGTDVHLSITRDQWDTKKREARFLAGDAKLNRKFLVRFTGSGKIPDWSETDW